MIYKNTGTIPVEQKQPYDKYDITQNTGTIPVEQKQPYDKYDIDRIQEPFKIQIQEPFLQNRNTTFPVEQRTKQHITNMI